MRKSRILLGFALVGVALGFASCGDNLSSYIPPAITPHDTTTVKDPDTLEFTPHVEGQPYDTYKGLIMCGYQGWHGTPADGSQLANTEHSYYHYNQNGSFRPGVMRNKIDFWPDMSEYTKKYVVGEDPTVGSSPFLLPNGDPASVYSSYDESSVLLHFKWMQDYGINGVFMQRFVGEVTNDPDHKEHFDHVLDNAMKGSNQYERAIAIMYDVTGASPSQMGAMVADAAALMEKYNLKDRTQQKFYLHENGKPMLTIWGVGFNDNSHLRPAAAADVVDQLKEQGWAIMLGCPAYWREGGSDCVTGVEHTEFLDLIKSVDVIMPWYVGRYDYTNFDTWKPRIAADIQWCKDNNVGYAVHTYPGGSDRNMHPNNGLDQPSDGTGGRYGGQFFWNQLSNAIKSGANSIYVGMFDEIDEGTAIYKQLNVKDVPNNVYDGPDYYVTFTTSGNYNISATEQTGTSITWSRLASSLNVKFQGIDDNLPTDHYLWLTGAATKMLNKQIDFTETIPNR